MNKLLLHWRVIVPALILAALFGFACVVCTSVLHSVGVLMSDTTAFNYDHLPRNYEGKTTRNLAVLQGAVVRYAQHHKGSLPPMQSPDATLRALLPFLEHGGGWCAHNPATRIAFMPNAALSGQKMGAVSNGGRAILFYDADPPAGYRESYYVSIKGAVGHVPVEAIPRLLEAAAAARAVSGKNGVFALSALPAGRAGVALKRPDDV